jgi:hypothetical protein
MRGRVRNDTRAKAKVRPVEGISHWCQGLDNTCAQVVRNNTVFCEAGHGNDVVTIAASGVNASLDASFVSVDVEDLFPAPPPLPKSVIVDARPSRLGRLGEAFNDRVDDLTIYRPISKERRRRDAQDAIERDARKHQSIEMLRQDEESKRSRAIAKQNGEDVSTWYTLGDRVSITRGYDSNDGLFAKPGSVGTICDVGPGTGNCAVECEMMDPSSAGRSVVRTISVPREYMGQIVTQSDSLLVGD